MPGNGAAPGPPGASRCPHLPPAQTGTGCQVSWQDTPGTLPRLPVGPLSHWYPLSEMGAGDGMEHPAPAPQSQMLDRRGIGSKACPQGCCQPLHVFNAGLGTLGSSSQAPSASPCTRHRSSVTLRVGQWISVSGSPSSATLTCVPTQELPWPCTSACGVIWVFPNMQWVALPSSAHGHRAPCPATSPG